MPIPSVKPSGLTVRNEIAGAATVSEVEPVTEPRVAEMVVGPAVTPVTTPLASIVATAVADETHVTSAVKSRLLPSVYLPVAVNCCVVFTGIDDAAGETLIELKLTAATVTSRLANPWIVPDFAVIVTVPLITPVAIPFELMLAIAESEELQTTEPVMSLLLPSENLPVAVNCWVAPAPMAVVPGDTCILVREAGTGVGEGVGTGVGPGLAETAPPPPQPLNIRLDRINANSMDLIFTSVSRPRQGYPSKKIFKEMYWGDSWGKWLRECSVRWSPIRALHSSLKYMYQRTCTAATLR